MSIMKSVYNFVPVSDQVYYPDWAERISQDVPFKDGMDGCFEVEVTARTPVFVRNGQQKKENATTSDIDPEFSHSPDGKYFIPATSIKGEVGNVLRILSFSKFNKISGHRYAIRDLNNRTYRDSFGHQSVHCGWLSYDETSATIKDCGLPLRISHEQIDVLFSEQLQESFTHVFSDGRYLSKGNHKSPIHKYDLTKKCDLRVKYSGTKRIIPNNPQDERELITIDPAGTNMGTIVFTGQPGQRKEIEKEDRNSGRKYTSHTGKYYEFVFPEVESGKEPIRIDRMSADNVFEDFLFIYQDSEEWKYWKEKHSIPVFFFVNASGELLHMGLSYLYKLPYLKKLNEYVPAQHKKEGRDLYDCIFGTAGRSRSLRGRVQFSNAFTIDELDESSFIKQIELYMGSPKPTYYPYYIKQKGEDGHLVGDQKARYKTMLDGDAELKGWKRYPVRKIESSIPLPPEGQEEHTNPARPVIAGTKFIFKVRYHNLKPVELGALINAIEIGKGYCHSIGFGKPFGFGSCQLVITAGIDDETKNKFIHAFVSQMQQVVENYKSTPQMNELRAMCRPENAERTTVPLGYMDLSDFVECKKAKQYLPYYSEMLRKESPLAEETSDEEAIVSFWDRTTKKAKLISGKDNQSKPVLVKDSRLKLKTGEHIIVKKIMRGGNVVELEFIKKK